VKKALKTIAIGVATGITTALIWELIQQWKENRERLSAYYEAKGYAQAKGKPLLVVGRPRWALTHPYGDVTIDIEPGEYEDAVKYGDVRALPFPNGYFGAALCSHVLEHLPSVEDAELAIKELIRVTDGPVFIVSPGKTSIAAQLHPGHRLWIYQKDGKLVIEQRGR